MGTHNICDYAETRKLKKVPYQAVWTVRYGLLKTHRLIGHTLPTYVTGPLPHLTMKLPKHTK